MNQCRYCAAPIPDNDDTVITWAGRAAGERPRPPLLFCGRRCSDADARRLVARTELVEEARRPAPTDPDQAELW